MKEICRRQTALFAAFALLVVPLSAVADSKEKDPDQIGNRDVGKGVNFYSLEKEIALGKQLAQEVQRQARIVEDPIIAEYVNRSVRISFETPTRKSPSPSRSSTPKKSTRSLCRAGSSSSTPVFSSKPTTEAEMAGVMAHEIGHGALGTAPARPPKPNWSTSEPFR